MFYLTVNRADLLHLKHFSSLCKKMSTALLIAISPMCDEFSETHDCQLCTTLSLIRKSYLYNTDDSVVGQTFREI